MSTFNLRNGNYGRRNKKLVCGVQGICSGLMGKEPDWIETLVKNKNYTGHKMPGYTEYSNDGKEKIVFTNPSQEEINELATPFLYECWQLYSRYKLYGLPNGKSYL